MSLLIAFGPQAEGRLRAMRAHVLTPQSASAAVVHDRLAAQVSVAAGRDQGVTTAEGVTLLLCGYVVGLAEEGGCLRHLLIRRFLEKGDAFVEELSGCFALLVHYKNESRLFSDRLGLRPLFMGEDAFGPLFASEAAPVLALLPRRRANMASLWQFLAAGRFFAGASPYEQLRLATPGTLYCFAHSLTHRPWYSYRIEADQGVEHQLTENLKELLDVAVARHYRASQGRTLMLSGGYDSRYLLNTLVERCGPRPELLTWLWCEPVADPESDLAWARREAARQGVPFEYFPIEKDPERFDEAFSALSGMIEQIFTHSDERHHARHLYARGFRSMFRGDELFGPDGVSLGDKAEALAKMGLVDLVNFPDAGNWLDDPGQLGRQAHRAHLEELATLADDPNDLRDLLYCRERLPTLQAHLNALRLPYLETHNPLLDCEVLEFNRRLSADWRTDKRLFRRCFLRYYPTEGFASVGVGFDWKHLQNPKLPLSQFMAERLARLPPPLNRAYFQALYRTCLSAPKPMPSAALGHWKRLARAVILGHWLRRWPV